MQVLFPAPSLSIPVPVINMQIAHIRKGERKLALSSMVKVAAVVVDVRNRNVAVEGE